MDTHVTHSDTALTLAEVARRLRRSTRTLRRQAADGYLQQWGIVELPRVGEKGTRMFSAASVDRFLATGNGRTTSEQRKRRAS